VSFQVLTAASMMMMEAARTSETSVDIQLKTRQYIPEDSVQHIGVNFNINTQGGVSLYML
jgi:hypothetical protein